MFYYSYSFPVSCHIANALKAWSKHYKPIHPTHPLTGGLGRDRSSNNIYIRPAEGGGSKTEWERIPVSERNIKPLAVQNPQLETKRGRERGGKKEKIEEGNKERKERIKGGKGKRERKE